MEEVLDEKVERTMVSESAIYQGWLKRGVEIDEQPNHEQTGVWQ